MLVVIGIMIGVIGVMIGLYIISKILYLAGQENAGGLFAIFGGVTIIIAIIGIIVLGSLLFDLVKMASNLSISSSINAYKRY